MKMHHAKFAGAATSLLVVAAAVPLIYTPPPVTRPAPSPVPNLIVPLPQGIPYTLVPVPRSRYSNIPPCYLVYGLEYRNGRMVFTDRNGQELPVLSQPKLVFSLPRAEGVPVMPLRR